MVTEQLTTTDPNEYVPLLSSEKTVWLNTEQLCMMVTILAHNWYVWCSYVMKGSGQEHFVVSVVQTTQLARCLH